MPIVRYIIGNIPKAESASVNLSTIIGAEDVECTYQMPVSAWRPMEGLFREHHFVFIQKQRVK